MKKFKITYDKVWIKIENPNAPVHYTQLNKSNETGKYMIFSDNQQKLGDLTVHLMTVFCLSRAKISRFKKDNDKGFGFVSCIYDYKERFKHDINEEIYKFLPATYSNVHQQEDYPFNYRYWKPDQQTRQEHSIPPNIKIYSGVMYDEETGEIVESHKVGLRDLKRHLFNKMTDKYPQIIDEMIEEDISFSDL